MLPVRTKTYLTKYRGPNSWQLKLEKLMEVFNRRFVCFGNHSSYAGSAKSVSESHISISVTYLCNKKKLLTTKVEIYSMAHKSASTDTQQKGCQWKKMHRYDIRLWVNSIQPFTMIHFLTASTPLSMYHKNILQFQWNISFNEWSMQLGNFKNYLVCDTFCIAQ
jgi:hypothetical protein